MKKIYLTENFVRALLKSDKKFRKILAEKLKEDFKLRYKFFTDSQTISKILQEEKEFSFEIFQNLDGFCEEILPFTKEIISLAIRQGKVNSLANSIPIAICLHYSLDKIYGFQEREETQLVPFFDFGRESK